MKKSKRLLAALLALVIFLGCLPTSISAANGTIYYDSSNIRYGTAFSFTNPYGDGFPDGKHNWDSSTTVSYIHVNDGIGYCIQPGIRIGDGPGDKVQYIGGSGTDYYRKMSDDLQTAIELAKLYGYPNKIGNKNGYYATQVLIWGLIIGQVDPNDFTGTNKFYTCLNSDSKDTVKSYYDQILNDLKNHATIPSFSSKYASQTKTITLKWNSSNKRYEATVTDENGILSKFDFSASGVKFSKNGNDLTISSTSSITQAKQASSEKDMPEVTVGSPNVWYSNASEWEQEVITGAAQPDPVPAYIKVQTEQPGAIALKKTSEDGVIAGVKFKISGNGVERTVVTGSDGSVKVSDLPPGTYTVSEVEIPGYYETPESQTVTLTAGETASVSFSNTLKKGDLVVTKTAEDGLKQGFTFKLTGTSDSGEKINLTAVTGTDGKATFQNVPIGSGYVLSEVNTPDYYIVPDNQTAAIEWNKVTNKSFYNELKKGRLTITKTAEDGFKEGFTFKLAGRADNGKWVKFIASTDENGKVTFEDIPIGSNYQVYEIHTPDYYVVPDTQDVVIEWNKVTNCSFNNELKKGKLTITKTAEDGFKEGFTFKLAGRADNGEWVKFIASTDKNGKVTFEDVPIGSNYQVYEIHTPGYYIVPDTQDVVIEWNKVTNCSFDNDLKKGSLTVTKTAEDGLKEGFTFRLTGTADNGQSVNLTATTDSTGKATFKDVPIGSGYVLSEINTPDYYIVPANQTADIEWNKVTNKSFTNNLKKGSLTITKTSEDGLKEGFTFRLTGTADSGQSVNLTAKTDETGKATFKNVPIGSNYTVTEVGTKNWYIVPDDQKAAIEWNKVTNKSFYNALKKGSLTVTKTAEDGLKEGFTFRLTGTADNGQSVNLTATTDSTGKATFKNVPIGSNYILSEINTPDYYVVPANQTAEIEWNKVTNKSFVNDLKKGSLTVTKTAEDGLKEGFTFRLTGTSDSGEKVDLTAKTDKTGKATFKDVPIGSGYVLSEINTPGHYVVPADQKVAIEWNKVISASVTNSLKKGSLTVTKTAEDGLKQGFTFRLTGTSDSGQKVDLTAVTGEDGRAVFQNVPIGSNYVLSEINTPDYYIVPANQTAAIEWNKVTNKSFTNKLKKGSLTVTKTAEDGLKEGFTFRLTGTSDSGEKVNLTAKTNSSGKATFTNVPIGSGYVLSEINTPDYYIVPDNQTADIEWNKVTNKSFTNNLKKGSLTVTKTTEYGLKEGLTFRLTGTSDSGEEINLTAKTDSNGKATFKNVPIGSGYVLSEINTPDYYIVPDNQTADIEWNEVTNKSFTNKLKKGSLTVTKTTEYGLKEGLTFRLTGTSDSGKKVDLTAKTNSSGKATFTNVPIGSGYVLSEINTPDYYIVPDNQTADIEWNEVTNKSFTNKLKKGSLTVTKTTEYGLKEGLTFRLTGTSDSGKKVDLTAKTNSSGKATFTDVPIGSGYVLSEINTPDYYIVPDNQTADIEWNKVTNKSFTNKLKKGSLTVTKTTEYGLTEGLTFRLTGTSDSGKKVDLTAKTNSSGKATFTNVPIGSGYVLSEINTPDYYIVPDNQTADIEWNKVTGKSFTNKLKKGSLTVTKTSEDGLKEGFTFRLTGTSDSGKKVNLTAKTDKNGKATFTDVPIGSGYVLSEVGTKDWYIVPDDQEADIEWNKVTNKSFYNALKKGDLTVTKTAEDGLKEGLTFRLTGTADNGSTINLTAVTGPDGRATFEDVPIGSGYVLSEVGTPDRYVIPDNQEGDIEWDKVTHKSVSNILKKFRVELHKSDAETGTAQGDAVLDGAEYTLYNQAGEKLETLTIKNGTAVSKYYPCQTITIRETKAPVGYQLDDTVYTVEAPPDGQTVEHITLTREMKDDVIKGKVAILKFLEEADDDGNIKPPLEGIEFTVTLNSDPSVKDVITTDENGYAETRFLPYGVYTITETKPPESAAPIRPFTVNISENKKVYHYILSNDEKGSLVKIVKADAGTGKIIPLAGVGFKIKDLSTGEWVTQHINYPVPTDIDEFFTSNDGTLMLPTELPYGDYELYETAPPIGYLLHDEPIPFTIDGTQEVVTVTCHDTAVKGEIQVEKIGERFTTVKQEKTEYGTQYTPVFTKSGLPDVEFTVTAAEQISAIDGTVLLEKGQVAGVITTGSNGKADLSGLPLGADGTARYLITETGAPDDHLTAEPVEVTLSYKDDQTPIVTVSSRIEDTRKKVQVTLKKQLEQDELFQIGSKEEYQDVVFGLFAEKDILSADGSQKIPAESLIAYTGIDAEGKADIPADLPAGKYYVQELATNDQYVLDGKKYPVVVDYSSQDVETVTIDAGNGSAVQNTLKRGSISGWKIDQDGFELGGAKIGLFPFTVTEFTEDSALMVTTSNPIGYFTFREVPYGNYLIREIESPEGFILTEDVFPVQITENGEEIKLHIQNQVIQGSVEVHKTNSEDTRQLLTGAVFGIYVDVNRNGIFEKEIDKRVDQLTETETGVYRMDDLAYGSYFVHEEQAPEGFVRDDGYYPFSITEDGKTVPVEKKPGEGFTNRPIRGNVEVEKTNSEDTGQRLSGAIFDVYTDKNGDGVFDSDTDELAGTLTEVEPGVYRMEALLYGDYLLHEEQAPEGFVPDDGYYPFSIKEDGKTVTLETKTGEGFLNKPIRGDVEVQKTNSEDTEQLLTGAVFAIYTDTNGNGKFDADTDKLAGNLTETESGVYRMEKLLYGDYLLHEEQAPEGFVRDDAYYPFSITEDGKTVTLETKTGEGFLNKPIRGDVEVQKTNSENTEQLLTGAVFAVYADANGDGRFDPDTEKPVGNLTETKAGVYRMEELLYGDYLLHEEQAPEGFVRDDGYYPFSITEDGKTVTLETKTGEGFLNKPIRGDVEVRKTNAENTDQLLTGAVFAVYVDANGNGKFDADIDKLVGDLTETEDGIYRMEKLLYGSYFLHEEQAPEGFVQDDGYYLFSITKDGETVEMESQSEAGFTNQPVRGNVEVRKTNSENSGHLLTGAVFGVYVDTNGNGRFDSDTDKLVGNLTETEKGIYRMEGLLYGHYLLHEEQAPEGYVQDKEYYTFSIAEDEKTIVLETKPGEGFTNRPIRSNVQVQKTSSENSDQLLTGAVFTVYTDTNGNGKFDTDADKPVGNLTETETGIYRMEALLYGDYLLHEEQAPEGFVPDDGYYPFSITEDGKTVTLETKTGEGFLNKPIRGDVEVQKTNSEDTEQLLTGAVFAIYTDTNGNGKFEADTDKLAGNLTETESGVYRMEKLLYGDYLLHEEQAPEGFVRDDGYYPFSIKEDGKTVTLETKSGQGFLNKPIRGNVEVQKTNREDADQLLTGAVFSVYIDADGNGQFDADTDRLVGNLTETEKGIYRMEGLLYGSYFLHEEAAPEGFVRDDGYYLFSITKDGETVEMESQSNEGFPNQPVRGSIEVRKTNSEDTDQLLTGAVFGVYADVDGNGQFDSSVDKLVGNLTEVETGTYRMEKLLYGNYLLHEEQAPEGFVPDDGYYPFSIKEDGKTVTLETKSGQGFLNKPIRGNVEVHKTNREDADQLLTGAVFAVYTDSNGNGSFDLDADKLVGNLTETEKGIYRMEELLYGSYFLHEETAPEGFVRDDGYYLFSITKDGETVEMESQSEAGFTNQPIRGNVEVRKTNSEDTEQLLTGAVFAVYADSNGNGKFEAATDKLVGHLTEVEAGTYRMEKLLYGNYLLHEEQAPEGFVRDDGYYPFSIKEDGKTITLETKPDEGFLNKPVRGNVEVQKTNSENAEQLLTGAVFGVYADTNGNGKFDGSVDKLVGNLTEVKAGTYRMEGLLYGSYFLHEEQAPEGFVRDDGYYLFSITKDGETVEMESQSEAGFTNQPIRGNVEVHKTNSENSDQLLTGAVFAVYIDADGNGKFEAATDKLVGHLTEVEAGTYRMEKLLYGNYLLHEEQAPEGFVRDDGYYSFSIREHGKTITLETKPGEGFLNKPIRGNVEVQKTNSENTEQLLTGAVFGVYADVDGNGQFDSSVDRLVGNLTEVEAGTYRMEGLLYGSYFLHEEQAPEGFVRDDDYYLFSITEDGKTITMETKPGEGFLNKPIRGNVEVQKTSSNNTEQLLIGAVFGVYADTNGNGKFDADTDRLVGNLTEVEAGIYRMEQLLYGSYFLHEEQAPEGFVRDDGYYLFSITEDGKTVKVETTSGQGFTNKPIEGELELTKKDASDGKWLPDTGVEILDKDGNVILQGRTDENGVIKFKLPYGEYFYREFDAPEGYQLDETAYPFSITEDGEIVQAVMTNERIPEAPPTGDVRRHAVAVLLTATSGVSLLLPTIKRKRKKKNRT